MLNDSQIVRLLDIANAGCHHGHVQDARTVYENVLLLRPGHAPARIGLAMSHIVVDDFAKAEELLRAVLAENENDADARAALGLCLMLSQRHDEARDMLAPLEGVDGPGAKLAGSLLEQLSPHH